MLDFLKSGRSEAIFAVVMVLILFVMVIPLPTFLLDLLLTTNISISLVILLAAFYLRRPLDMTIFPIMLLFTTLFRLSLNVASTRLILSEGEAGALITAFGQFVVSGNYIVGTIIFLVLVIINFIVITKGSGRIAEVTARFTLDAMPGKQMAIDADLNAGLIDEDEARTRRSDISREADFYGAMDGASKFVRGDAIAGLLITAINIVGGLIIGVVQLDMGAGEAAATFTLLSIGDGLVSQIPSLLISTAAGIVVTRASGASNISADFKKQMAGNSQPILITSGFMFLIGIVPNMPLIPFWVLAGAMLVLGRSKLDSEKEEVKEKEKLLALKESESEEGEVASEEDPQDMLLVDPLELEIGYALIPIVDPNQEGDLLSRISTLRKQLAIELGVVIPPVRIRDNVSIGGNNYAIKIRDNKVANGEILPGYHLALLPEEIENPPAGIQTVDPTFGLPALWVAERSLPEAEKMGLTVVEAPAVITTHLLEVLRQNAWLLLDRQEVKKLMDKVKEQSPALIEELIPNLLTIGAIQQVLKKLLREAVPIRDLVTILETLADYAPITQNVDVLMEHVRSALSSTITRQYVDLDEKVHVFVLNPMLEQQLLEHAQTGRMNPTTLGFEPEIAETFLNEAKELCDKQINEGFAPLLLTSPVLRATLFKFLSSMQKDIAVLSYNDLRTDVPIDVMGQLSLK